MDTDGGFLQVGDVFVSPSLGAGLVYELVEHDDRPPTIDRGHLDFDDMTECRVSWTERRPDGWERKRHATIDLGAADTGRGEAEWVVIESWRSQDGYAHGPHDTFSGGWCVRARRLKPDGERDPDGETVFFRQSGDFRFLVEDARKVRVLEPEASERAELERLRAKFAATP